MFAILLIANFQTFAERNYDIPVWNLNRLYWVLNFYILINGSFLWLVSTFQAGDSLDYKRDRSRFNIDEVVRGSLIKIVN